MINYMMVAFHLPGGMPVYTYSLLLGSSAALGLIWIVRQAPPKEGRAYLDVGLWTLIGGLLGGRLAFVGLHWSYFKVHPIEIPQIYLGGMDWGGVSAGALFLLVLVAALTHKSLGKLADGLLPLLACLAVGVWLGSWLDGTAYGFVTSTWWGIPARDEWSQLALRWPIQLMGALSALGFFWLLDWGRRWIAAPGQAAGFGMLGLSLEVFALSFLRADPMPKWRGMALSSWTALGFAFLAGLTIVISTIWFSTMNKGQETQDEIETSSGTNQHSSG